MVGCLLRVTLRAFGKCQSCGARIALGRGVSWFSAGYANPAFGAVFRDLDVRVTGVGEEVALVFDTEAGRTEELHDGRVEFVVGAALVALGDDQQGAAGLEDAEDFLHVVRQIGPIVLGFNGGGQIEFVVGKGKLRDGGLLDFDAAGVQGGGIFAAGGGDAALGVIHAVDFAIGGEGGEFLDGSAAAAADVEQSEVFVNFDVLQAPVGESGMGTIHEPGKGAAGPF